MTAASVRPLDVRDEETARAVLAVQRAAYRVEADLIGFDGIPPLWETLEELRRSTERWLGIQVDGTLAGIVAWERPDSDTVEISRLAVRPEHARRGHGRRLLTAAVAAEPARRVLVATGSANRPAVQLYRSERFVPVGAREVAPGVEVTTFERST